MNVLITGSTGMVGKSVLYECIKDDRIKKIYLINRSPINIINNKVEEFIEIDFIKISDLKNKIDKLMHVFIAWV